MTPYYSDDLVTIYHGDCREWMPEADAIVTDPPYGTNFAGVVGDDAFPFRLLAAGIGRTCIAFGSGRNHVRDMRTMAVEWTMPDRVMAWAPAFGWSKAADSGVIYGWHPIYCWRIEQTGRGEPARDVFTEFEANASSITKPVSLMRRLLPMTTGTILDPFMGSGSTLAAAKSLGRRAIGIEIEERWCERAATACSQEVLGLVV